MRKRNLSWVPAVMAGVSLVCIGTASAYPAPAAEEIATCTPDALRLCGQVLFSGRIAVFNCMRANKHRLSAQCRAIFIKHGL